MPFNQSFTWEASDATTWRMVCIALPWVAPTAKKCKHYVLIFRYAIVLELKLLLR